MTSVDEQALRAELEQVRSDIVDLWSSGDAMSGREIVGSAVGGLGLGAALLLTAFLLTGSRGQETGVVVTTAVLVLLTWAVTWWGLHVPLRRRTLLYRDVRRLRRRERELAALLPAGTAGANSYRRYYGQRFGNPALLVLYAGMLVVLLLVLLS